MRPPLPIEVRTCRWSLTGSIATGKSHLCRYLVERYGAVHVDVDQIVHRMYDPGTPGFHRVVGAFGRDVVGADGSIDRRILGRKIFGSLERAIVLRDAIGNYADAVRAVVDRWRAELPQQQIAVLEAFNLVEGGYNAWCDVNWLLRADAAVALGRILGRDQLDTPEARARLASARPWQVRAHACDRIIDDDGGVREFEAAIATALAETLAR